MDVRSVRKLLLRWCGWFLLFNALVFFLLSLKYLPSLFPGEFLALTVYGKCLVGSFIVLTYLSYLALLAALPGLLLVPAIVILPWRRTIIFLAVILFTGAATYLYLDAVVYSIYRYHVQGVVLNLFLDKQAAEVFAFSSREYWSVTGLVLGSLLVEWLGACTIWNTIIHRKTYVGAGKWFVIFFASCGYLSYSLVVFSGEQTIGRVLRDNARFLPFYYNLILPAQMVQLERSGEREFMQPAQMYAPLNYPHASALHCQPAKTPLNVVFIVVDAWRFDMLDPKVTPAIYQFAKTAWQFTHHVSGGNATGPGLFSLFYGIPASYWDSMQASHQGPVLLDVLLQQHYQMGIFGSATLLQPAFDKTVFSAIPHLRLGSPGARDAYERDKIITQEFKKFVRDAAAKPEPFFGFLFYDSSHSYCEINNNLKPFVPVDAHCDRFKLSNHTAALPYLNRYKNSLLLVDQQVQQVLALLAEQKLLDKTIIIITGDHGEEFNDNKLGYWGHASNFTRYQVQTPLIVHWPGKFAQVFAHHTSHFDVAPTLLNGMFNCQAKIASYSVGMNLLAKNSRPYLMVGSYIDFALVEKDRITTVYPLGNYTIESLQGQPLVGASLRSATLQEMMAELTRYRQRQT
jgi:membrane-anchored protein YejM (alkaline phosphatase superfamily)